LRKIGFILCLMFLGYACSVGRIREGKFLAATEFNAKGKGLEGIKRQNLTANSFFIQKAEFKVVSQDVSKDGLGSIKFEKPDKYLISLKSKGGIEVARIFISDDTVLINDRIRKKLYYGSPAYLKSRYGVTASVLPLLLGDYINDEVYDTGKVNCREGKFNIEAVINRLKVNYVIDCGSGKTIFAQPEHNIRYGKLQIRYSDFLKTGEAFTPGKIEISDSQNKMRIEIKIDKIESPWEGTIQFVPGNKYEKIHLL
jgi:hypothetical protein